MRRYAYVLLLLLFAGVAEAGLEARWAITFADPDGRLHYVYRIVLVSGTLEPGSAHSQHITLYDVPRLIPDNLGTQPDWVATVQMTGVDADDISLHGKDDTPKLLNITWTWNGTAPITAPHDFGYVSFDITSGGRSGTLLFVGQSTGPRGTPRALIGRALGPQTVVRSAALKGIWLRIRDDADSGRGPPSFTAVRCESRSSRRHSPSCFGR